MKKLSACQIKTLKNVADGNVYYVASMYTRKQDTLMGARRDTISKLTKLELVKAKHTNNGFDVYTIYVLTEKGEEVLAEYLGGQA